MEKTDGSVTTENSSPRRHGLLKVGSAAAFMLMALFLIGITGISGGVNGWSFLQENWLMVLFKINASFQRASPDLLNVLNLLDIVIILLFGLLFLALFAALRNTNKIWSAITASLPFLGLILFLITHTAGRSALLVGGLIFSIIMLRSDTFNKVSAYTGIVASTLLFFAGDLGTALFPPSNVIAILIGIGYVLWIVWFFLIGRRLFRLGNEISRLV